ncbi:MAG TPA: hypothetical protein VFQ67_07845 [Allosphingosinicella sp.]|jgi:hypothetical protein|nr:hypothetical protein [Allosphingosinicella sp.]
MAATPNPAAVAADPLWLPNRYDESLDLIHFVRLTREEHRSVTFITDEYIRADAPRLALARRDVAAAAGPPGPLHFIFHSAYCCSTVLARAVDIEGVSMGLKEPLILNDLVGWRRRGAEPSALAAALDDVLALLARPFSPGEAVVVKPSNVLNGIAAAMLGARPQSRAILLYAPLPDFLRSIARKGLWGRRWARELFIGQLRDGIVDLGLGEQHYLDLTDLQVAAAGWLAQQEIFNRLIARFGTGRVRALDSAALMARPGAAMTSLSGLFGLGLDEAAVQAVLAGPAFTSHSKSNAGFSAADRDAEQRDAAATHADEIDKVAVWAEAVAAAAGVSLQPEARLLP